jgi:hypothetical protein
MGSIVYGDIIPFTISEELYCILAMLVGKLFLSFLFAEVASYEAELHSTYSNHMSSVKKINKWMNHNNI